MRQKTAGQDLKHRGALLVALWAGFYLLAFGISAGLLFAAYAVFAWIRSPSPFMLLFALGSVFAAGMILWSSFPRWTKFEAPGPKVDPKTQPRLFEEIRRLARDTRQKPPVEIYLEADVNAWVAQRGGFMGLFSRRVMCVGLPLIRMLTVSEFRTVLAHEFGHYVGGDTALGPWIYRTHAALQRTLQALEGNDSLWRFPFLGYAKLFTRASRAISQQQELAADALAARIGGAKAFARALELTEGAGSAFPEFVREEMVPALNAKFRPPLCEGFERYIGSKDVTRLVGKRIGWELTNRKRDPYQTHPPLAERLEEIAKLPPGLELREDPPALTLVSDLDEMEREVLSFVTANARIRKFPTLAWSDVAEKAFLPQWRDIAKTQRRHLRGMSPERFLETDLTELGKRIERFTSAPEARSAAIQALGTALIVSLRELGWTVHSEPGERVSARQGECRVEPFHVFTDFAEGRLTQEEWRRRCRSYGLEGLNLGPAELPPPTP